MYETKGVLSASTLAGARVREKVVAGLKNTRCDGLAEARARPVTVEPCDGGLCVSHAWSGREKVAVTGGEAAGRCDGRDRRWRFVLSPTLAAFDPVAGAWFVTAFDARLEAACDKITTVWEVTGAPV